LHTAFRRLPGMPLPLQVIEPRFTPALTLQQLSDADADAAAAAAAAAAAPPSAAAIFDAILDPDRSGARAAEGAPSLSATVQVLRPDRHLHVLSPAARVSGRALLLQARLEGLHARAGPGAARCGRGARRAPRAAAHPLPRAWARRWPAATGPSWSG
jgi:hypothetical protein